MSRAPDFTHRLLLDAGRCPGMEVLDFGCGSGDATLLAAGRAGETGSVIGLDRGGNALMQGRSGSVPGGSATPGFRQADLVEFCPTLGDGCDRRSTAVVTLARYLRPGGIVVFQEHDATMTPTSLASFPHHPRARAGRVT